MTNEQFWELKFNYRCDCEDWLRAFVEAAADAWASCEAQVRREDAEMAEIDLVRA